MRLERYHKLFLAQVDVMSEVGVTIPDTALVQHVAEQHGRGAPIAADHEEGKQMALTIQFIKGTNATSYAMCSLMSPGSCVSYSSCGSR